MCIGGRCAMVGMMWPVRAPEVVNPNFAGGFRPLGGECARLRRVKTCNRTDTVALLMGRPGSITCQRQRNVRVT